jgi:isopentenyl diphosphate isomerase/L-lactate dehydrogenase-like FMN-dependent dehydrogenase
LIDVTKVDPSVEILGVKWPTPIVINPVGSQRAFHPEGELAVARAAKAKNHLQVLSTVATTSIEDCIAARGASVWFQLYHQEDWNQTKQMVKRAEHAGAPVVVFTVDLIGGSNRETMVRSRATDTRTCTNCHLGGAPMPGATGRVNELRDNRRKPAIADLKPDTPSPEVGTPTWDWVKRLQDSTSMKVFIKGIVTREDAELAMTNGVNGLFVSNHGGRAENSQRGTIECLPEVLTGVRGRAPVVIDGGFRRGTDIFKALALGATAVGVGRPYIWGLGAFGQEGVETVLTLLRRELELVMRQAGTTSVKAITGAHIVAR